MPQPEAQRETQQSHHVGEVRPLLLMEVDEKGANAELMINGGPKNGWFIRGNTTKMDDGWGYHCRKPANVHASFCMFDLFTWIYLLINR